MQTLLAHLWQEMFVVGYSEFKAGGLGGMDVERRIIREAVGIANAQRMDAHIERHLSLQRIMDERKHAILTSSRSLFTQKLERTIIRPIAVHMGFDSALRGKSVQAR